MKKTIILAATLLLFAASSRAGDLTLEVAGGFGSPYFPFSSHFSGTIDGGGLFHKEIAARASYPLRNWLSLSATVGYLRERPEYIIYMYPETPNIPPYSYRHHYPRQNVTYFIPTFKLSYEIFRVDIGGIIYSASQEDRAWREFDYPFNGSHLFKPSMRIELGEQGLYVLVGTLSSFPLLSCGMLEAGVGGRVSGLYEHKVTLIGGPYEAMGVSYRGEVRVYKRTAVSLGVTVAGTDHDNLFLVSLGVKTII
jgi:hypothetical protein